MPTIKRPAVLGAKILNSKGLLIFFKYIVLHTVNERSCVTGTQGEAILSIKRLAKILVSRNLYSRCR